MAPPDGRLIQADADKKTRGMPLEMLLILGIGVIVLVLLAYLGQAAFVQTSAELERVEGFTDGLGSSGF